MKTKYYLLTIVITFFISNVFTTLWYMVMDDQNYVSFRREEINYIALIINHLIYATIMVYLFPFYYHKKPMLSDAFKFGAIIAGLMFIPSALVVRSIWTVEINTIFFANTLAHLVIGGIMAIAIHFIARKHLTIDTTKVS